MNITEFLNNGDQEKGFSFEVLPPLKGNGLQHSSAPSMP